MRCFNKKNQAGFSFLELLIPLGIISVLGFTALQHEIEKTEMDVAEAFGMDIAPYSQAVASYSAGYQAGFEGFSTVTVDEVKFSLSENSMDWICDLGALNTGNPFRFNVIN